MRGADEVAASDIGASRVRGVRQGYWQQLPDFMRTALSAFAAAFVLMSQVTAEAAEYLYLSGHAPNWRTSLLEWLHRQKPTPENITAGITDNFDIHVYAVLDSSRVPIH
jgi:hypothetical protein